MTGTIPGRSVPWPIEPGEDALSYLRRSRVTLYQKGQTVFREGDPADGLYLVTAGKVAVARHTTSGAKLLVDIYSTDEFFGESALADPSRRPEEVEILEDAALMRWSNEEIQDAINREPRLGIALLRIVAQRTLDFVGRIEVLASDSIPRRLARSLVRFSRLGVADKPGVVHMPPLTHELLAQHVGTSREVVTLHMNDFRRRGLLTYTRTEMTVFLAPLEAWLRGWSML